MSKAVKLLVVEDSEDDARIAVRLLQRGGFKVQFERVDTARALEEALSRQSWDAVIADYRMPDFTGLEALKIVRARGSDLPFILVSGTVGEEIAVDAMKAGANDFVIKRNLSRLGSVLERELREAENRAARRCAQEQLREREAGLQRAQVMARLAHVITGPNGEFLSWSETLPRLIGVRPADMVRSTREWLELTHPEDRAIFRGKSTAAGIAGVQTDVEYRLRHSGGGWLHVLQTMEPLEGQSGTAETRRWFNTIQDITEQKRVDQELRRFRMAMDVLPDSMYITDPTTMRFVYLNNTACERLGHSRERLLQMGPQDVLPIGCTLVGPGYDEVIAAGDRGMVHERPLVQSDGITGTAEIHSRALHTGEGTLIITIGRDITERKRADEQVRRLNRVHAVLSGINAAIVRISDRQELFQESCRIATTAGRFVMAWIGIAHRGTSVVKPVAWAGDVRDFFDAAPMDVLGNMPGGHGLAGRAIRSKLPVISNDVKNDTQRLMRKELDERGINSLAVLPLIVNGEAVGALALYAADVGFFDDEEMRLLAGLAGDISFALDHIERAEKLDYISYYDPLTGLPNRALFQQRLKIQLEDAARKREKVALLVLDVERFKTVNDTLGRQAGDALLKEVANRIQRGLYAASWAARIGADHFAIVVSGWVTEEELGRRIEARFTEMFTPPFPVAGTEVRIAARIGIALFPNDGADVDVLFHNAEAAVKKSKATGERYLFYTQEMTTRIAAKLSLENKLRQALEKEQFVLHYQPKVDLETRHIVGVEALIRWQSPELGLVPPGEFIALLEETGLILQVGSWALTRAAVDHRAWVEQKLNAPRVAVNVSQIQLRQRDFVQVVEQAIIDGVAPTGIDLELTESLLMQDVQANIAKLKAVRSLGVRVAIDDFGTGYSSLAYLAKLPVETLKIDRAFVSTMLDDPDNATLVQTMISLAHSLRLKVVAEGVETEEQAKMLRLLRCDEMQGYLFSKPIPFLEMTGLLKQRRI